MILKRKNGTTIELTPDEVYEIHKRFVTEWMESVVAKELNDNTEIPVSKFKDIADSAYDIYAQGDGYTEYESVLRAIEAYEEEYIK